MFPKHEASCTNSAERNEAIHISLTPSIQLFLLSTEGLIISPSLTPARTHWGMQNASCSSSSAREGLCLAKFKIGQRFCRLQWLLGMSEGENQIQLCSWRAAGFPG